MKHLRDKTVVITGASSGIGRAAALEFAKKGSNVVLAARRIERLEEVKVEVEAKGVKTLIVPTDLTIVEHRQRLIDASIEHFGQIDVLVNNAGTGLIGSFIETPMDEVRKLFELDFFAAVELMQSGLKVMERQGWGVIINTASLAGLLPSAYMPIYDASKAALIMLSQSTAIEYMGTQIHVVALCPGVTETEFSSAEKKIGRFQRWISPIRGVSAEWVAERIVRAALKPKPLITQGPLSFIGRLGMLMTPPVYYVVTKRLRDYMKAANPPVSSE